MARYSNRANSLLKKFAPMIGGVDVKGVTHPETAAKFHIFAVKNFDQAVSHVTLVNGVAADGFIKNDTYDIEYVGHQRHFKRLEVPDSELTKDEKAFRKRYLEFAKRHEADIEEMERVRKEEQGVFDFGEASEPEAE